MAVYTIADLHLSFGTDKPMDVFQGWANYTEKIEKNWKHLITNEDTVVIAGDISWAMELSETFADFRFIQTLDRCVKIIHIDMEYRTHNSHAFIL